MKHVAILGAGAVGAYFIWHFADAEDVTLTLIAEGERQERLRQGVVINGRRFMVPVQAPEEVQDLDLLLVAVKAGALQSVIPDIKTLVDNNRDTLTVMTLLNGVSAEREVGSVVGNDVVLPSVMRIASQRTEAGVTFDDDFTPGVSFGETDGSISSRMQAVDELFRGHGIKSFPISNILQDTWTKFCLNVSMNLPQAILNVGVGAYRDSEHVRALQLALIEEVIAVAASEDVDIAELGRAIANANIGANWARYSTLQDLDAKRPTEVDLFAGEMMRLGAKNNVPVPYATFCFHVIKALEEKNAGHFDY